MEKLKRGSADAAIDDNSKIAFVRWKNNKVVTVISSKYGLNSTAKTLQYIRRRKVEPILSNHNASKNALKEWVELIVWIKKQPRIWLRTEVKNGGGQSSVFCLNLCANNRLQIFRHQKENPGQKPLGLLGLHVALLTRITDAREKPPK